MRACPSCLSVYFTDAEFCGLDGVKLIEATGDPLAGKIIGKYRLQDLIGTGASGLVYRSVALDSGAPLALKLLFGEMACDRRVVARFRREAETASRMRHENIVAVHDFAVLQSGLAYLVMELLSGVTLDQAISRDAPFPHERAAAIAQQIAAGLAEAHRQGFVHRDLKPGNVMLVPGGEQERVKILDFGIVGTMRSERGESRLTKTGYVVGTPAYMAPEQIDESVELGPPADVYALGVILYEMLAGRAPFGGSVEQILVRKLTRDPDPLPECGEIGALTLAMLRRNPAERPPTALHVSAELHRLSLLTEDPKTVLAQRPWPVDVINAPTLTGLGEANISAAHIDPAAEPTPGRGSPLEDALPLLPAFTPGATALSFALPSSTPTDSAVLGTGDHTDPGIPLPQPSSSAAENALLQPAATLAAELVEQLDAQLRSDREATRHDVTVHTTISNTPGVMHAALADTTVTALADQTLVAPAAPSSIFRATAIANLREEALIGSETQPDIDPQEQTAHVNPTVPERAWFQSRLIYVLVGVLGFVIGLFTVSALFSTRDASEVLARPAPREREPERDRERKVQVELRKGAASTTATTTSTPAPRERTIEPVPPPEPAQPAELSPPPEQSPELDTAAKQKRRSIPKTKLRRH